MRITMKGFENESPEVIDEARALALGMLPEMLAELRDDVRIEMLAKGVPADVVTERLHAAEAAHARTLGHAAELLLPEVNRAPGVH